jgi:glycerol-3-phosphate dehydrogenase
MSPSSYGQALEKTLLHRSNKVTHWSEREITSNMIKCCCKENKNKQLMEPTGKVA